VKNLWTGTEAELRQNLQHDNLVPARQSRKAPALDNPRALLTVNEAARYLKVSRRTVHTLMKSKQLTFSRVRSSPRLRVQHLEDYLDKRTVIECAINHRKRRTSS
jgi:excisionase family DNA binding protein